MLPDRALNALIRNRLPRSAQLEATTACNLACPLCGTHVMPRGHRHLAPEHVRNVLDGSRGALRFVCFHVLGEPLLNPRLFESIRLCADAGVETSFSTNGMLLHRHLDEIFASGLSFLSIAIDGVDAADYAKYRVGGDFDTVVRNTRELIAEKRRRGAARPAIQVQMVMFSFNEAREDEALGFLRAFGADAVSLKRPSYAYDADLATAAVKEFWSKVDRDSASRTYARPTSPRRLYRNRRMCPQLERAVVLSDGKVVACCMDSLGESAFGDASQAPFEEIWRGAAHREVLDRFLNAASSRVVAAP